jgi:hypothetical protein
MVLIAYPKRTHEIPDESETTCQTITQAVDAIDFSMIMSI